jgi:hypothetical protein
VAQWWLPSRLWARCLHVSDFPSAVHHWASFVSQFDTLASEHKAEVALAATQRVQYESRVQEQAASIGELQAVIAANEHAVKSQRALVGGPMPHCICTQLLAHTQPKSR